MSLPPSNPLGAKLCFSLVILPANVLSVGVVLAQTPLGRQRVAAGPTLQDDEPQLALILHLSRDSEWDEAHKSAGDSDDHFSAGNFYLENYWVS